MSGFRLDSGGRVDRSRTLHFQYDGQRLTGHPGDTLASALLANGARAVTTSIARGRPRGIVAAGVEEPNALVQVEEPFPEPMLTATTLELYDGLVAIGLAGRGRLADRPDPARYDSRHAHCDVLVVGAGAAGLAAALTAARAGARVVLADERPELGGRLLTDSPTPQTQAWVRDVVRELAAQAEVTVLTRTTVTGYYDHNYLTAVERRTNHLGAAAPANVARERLWHLRARHVVLATGAHERPLVFAANDLPGVMLAGAVADYLHRYGVACGRRAVVATTNDSAYPVALDLAAAGMEVAAIADARDDVPQVWARRAAEHGIDVLPGHLVARALGETEVTGARLARVDAATGSTDRDLDCDLVLVSGGWTPAVHLYSQSQGSLRFDEVVGAFVPDVPRQAQQLAGSVRGLTSLTDVLADGARAGEDALAALGRAPRSPVQLPEVERTPVQPPRPVWLVRPVGDDGLDEHFVDLQRDATAADVLRATGAGLRSVEHVKRYTTIGTAHDQGKTSGLVTAGIVADVLRESLASIGTTTYRPPYVPTAFATLAGRNRGELSDPVRVTALHDRHVELGAVFEDVGQWKRPRYYPRATARGEREGMEAAVDRECRAARTSVACMDASTLGKIDVQGPDAAELLDRLYTNLMSSLKVGSIRYGVMCHNDGMVFDDGTVTRVADDRFLVTTTTGNAAAVLEWMEEWLQTEWPQLRVHLTSVTDHWATVALVGPRSRAVLSRLAPELPVSNEEFPFMAWRDGLVAGLAARVCRISFSGELAYELNVPAWDAPALWDAVLDAGNPEGITPYGTETMHVLRAEKGYPIIGQDTDGTVTPQDLGMAWVVSKKKPDFVGKRSFARPDTARSDRKHLVGLLSVDPDALLPEGGQLVDPASLPGGSLPAPPVPMLGHVTSSYRSAALGRTFALALLRAGRDRVGEIVCVVSGDVVLPATVTEPVLYDKEGARRDG